MVTLEGVQGIVAQAFWAWRVIVGFGLPLTSRT